MAFCSKLLGAAGALRKCRQAGYGRGRFKELLDGMRTIQAAVSTRLSRLPLLASTAMQAQVRESSSHHAQQCRGFCLFRNTDA